MLQNGVQSGSLFAMYMMNRPEFLFAHLGSWSIGSAPAWINYNLAGDALVHCLKVSGAKFILVDEDSECRRRIEEVRERLEGELGMVIKVLDGELKGEIARMEPIRPGDEMRAPAKGKFPLFLFYTRYVLQDRGEGVDEILTDIVAQQDTPKHVPSKHNEQSDLPAAWVQWASSQDQTSTDGMSACLCTTAQEAPPPSSVWLQA